ncbi:semaphorin-2A isoform X1 [Lingula anatina]|uniref:Semaphorin-2A n=1 Tax=Lingula anatina TaxID=7574 RepID=A0A1S3JWP8_LINAN|nr:semaphorin-2A isoform X1 [Lingula anatina]XP_013414453.1 semaphorin-2A isoform X1 [Lingula anatina]XP_013414455.1 semaphorin-2A isoform X1 [Lingula anatina]XP_013414456.1 semaphorin-2A isoform X1 [Lingula anatina]XP_013414458.1 semaphorin-2A isoform X1 [Lingula anatina]XP_013414459.1 semaphorin-2A isoform X1 [Lingula anatina]XP_013414460.1 semaphorin-2A isoform X1 [Lingula anatina]XP_013414461.1 semaphorin-2A isoform X1 [Lingula anatina]XP_013414462.1 semaphorin-2A isoform X1 [Lingula an|eukprot:XP_013414452.1 semaphorin-2A isoform X1 [Lingula anatina]
MEMLYNIYYHCWWHILVVLCIILTLWESGSSQYTLIKPDNTVVFKSENYNSNCSYKGYYRYLEILNASGSPALFVGARDYVFKLNLENISDSASSNSIHPENYETCDTNNQQGSTSSKCFQCGNHVRVIVWQKDDSEFYICGTGAKKPQDFILFANLTVRKNGTSSSGVAKCPFDPDDNATAVWVEKGNPGNVSVLYSGTVADAVKSDPVIYRPEIRKDGNIESKLVRTVRYDSKWLNEPHFVASFDISTDDEEYVYFFFRETAAEFVNCGKAVYARVARVCKDDKGGRNALKDNWTTYLKARLNCSLPGEFPFYFNELQDVVRVNNAFYATFTTNLNGFYGSAVCTFDLSTIEDVFNNGKFKEQKDATSNWLPVQESNVPQPRPGKCSNNSLGLDDTIINFIYSRPLMDQAIPMREGRPLYYRSGVIFRKIAVENSLVAGQRVLYLGTNNAKIYKLASTESCSQVNEECTSLSSVIEPLQDDTILWSMKYFKHSSGMSMLYLGTDDQVTQVPVDDQCNHYKTCGSCTHDPHCNWDVSSKSCTADTSSSKATCSAIIHTETESGAAVVLQGSTNYKNWTHNGTLMECQPVNKTCVMTATGDLVLLKPRSPKSEGEYTCNLYGGDKITYNLTVLSPQDAALKRYEEWCDKFDEYKNLVEEYKENACNAGCLRNFTCS